MPHIVADSMPAWMTPEIARQMADEVLMACAEAGYPEAEAWPVTLFEGNMNFYFTGVPEAVAMKAGVLVRQRWQALATEQSDEEAPR